MSYADLHLHSHYSDGLDSPTRVVERAKSLGMAAMALTDHDSIGGVSEAREAAAAHDIRFLTGVEIGVRFERVEVHVLGLGIDITYAPLCEGLDALQTARARRMDTIVAQLVAAGVDIDPERIRARIKDGSAGRMHVASELHERRIVRNVQEAFDRFLNPGRPGYVPKAMFEFEQALELIHAAGGLAFVGHPGLRKDTRHLLPKLLEHPFDGIEAYHISHSPGRTDEFVQIAKERGLLVCGGSDCHGGAKGPVEMGLVRLPLHYFDAIEAALQPK